MRIKRSMIAMVIGISLVFPPQVFGQAVDSGETSQGVPETVEILSDLPTMSNSELPVRDSSEATSDIEVDLREEEIGNPAPPMRGGSNSSGNSGGSSSDGGEEGSSNDPPYTTVQPEASVKHIKPEVDLSSGALTYRYPFNFPPGRKGFTPELSLSYNSQNRKDGSFVGYGWDLSIPYIVRENRHGHDLMYDTQKESFSSSIDGPLVLISDNQFGAKTENGEYNQYSHVTGGLFEKYWELTTREGLTYIFGKTSSAKQHFPTATSTTYKWMLEEIKDVNGNEIKFSYTKGDGQTYPDKIEYMYINPGSGDGVFSIHFIWNSRIDIHTSFASGFEVTTDKYLINIDVKESGALIKRYNFSYDRNPTNLRARLRSINEEGDPWNIGDGKITLPPTTFTYTSDDFSFVSNETGQFPPTDPDIDSLDYTEGVVLTDVNGDAYADVVQSMRIDSPAQDKKHVWINNRDGTFTESSTLLIPTNPSTTQPLFICIRQDTSTACDAKGAILFDIQGDLLTDFIYSQESAPSSSRVFENNGIQWSHVLSWNGQVDTLDPFFITRPFLNDLDSDGLVDYLTIDQVGGLVTRLNSGLSMLDLATFGSSFLDQKGFRLIDLNADGLADIFRSYESAPGSFDVKVFTNESLHGDGFVEDSTYSPLNPIKNSNTVIEKWDTGTTKTFLADLNGDNLPELISNTGLVYLRNWKHWAASAIQLGAEVTGVTRQVGDINGDGLSDVFYNVCDPTCTTEVLYNTGTVPDLLSKIELSTGGEVNVRYKASSQYEDQSGNALNPVLPLTVQTVEHIIQTDPISGSVSTTTYEYADGQFYFKDPHERKFSGFRTVTETRPDGSGKITYFHQGDPPDTFDYEFADHRSKIGKPFRVDILDTSDALMSRSTTKWNTVILPSVSSTERFFVHPLQQITENYDGNGTRRDTAMTYVFDSSNGNLLTKDQWGEVDASDPLTFSDIGNDFISNDYTYATNASGTIQLPAELTLEDSVGTTVSQQRFYYDDLLFGSLTKGNLTKEESLIDGLLYASTTRMYNSFGLLLEERDPNSNPLTYEYDAFNLYPATTTNALGQATIYDYDYTAGAPEKIIDPNGEVRETIYDSVDRVIEKKGPDPTTGISVTIETIEYTDYQDPQNPTSITETNHLSSSLSVDSTAYLDGFGRVIQTRTRAEDIGAPTYVVSDIIYDVVGRVDKESLPYFDAGSIYTNATSTQSLYVIYTYDALDRPIAIANVLGTTTTAYDDWRETVTDANGNSKEFERDAFGRLISVDEFITATSSPYTTLYEYNLIGNLTELTDSLGNIRNFTYDKLGRRLSAEDLHGSTDTSFGTYSFIYDDAGNLKQKQTPNGDTIDYDYDVLNRPISEDLAGVGGTEITYGYDTCSNGISRLCSASRNSFVLASEYDEAGNVESETKTINSTPYTTTYTYDYQGNQSSVTNPNASVIDYTYNLAGLPETVLWTESGSSPTAIVENFDYAPTGAVSFQDNANGTELTNTYNQDELYRLNKKEFAAAATPFKTFTYGYDPIGNIESIIAADGSGNATTSLYTYDGLYRLTNAETGDGNIASSTRSYSYDAIGNLFTSPQGVYLYEGNIDTNTANPHAVTKVASTTMSYDNNGNLTFEERKSKAFSNTWNYRNELVETEVNAQVKNPLPPPRFIYAQTDIDYTYDPSGMRISFSWQGLTTDYPSPFYNTNGSKEIEHVIANGIPVATITTQGANPPTFAWNHQDHLGSTSLVTDDTATIVEQVEYYPFGWVSGSSGSNNEQLKFTGHELDKTTKYTYAKARYLETKFGKFISQDPNSRDIPEELLTDPQQLNTYAYSRNNPLIFVDRDGKKVELAARPVIFGGLHLFYIVTPDNPNAINFAGVPEGTEKFTIGAYNCSCGGVLGLGNEVSPDTGYIGDPTQNSDFKYLVGDEKIASKKLLISAVQGQSDTDFINSLGQAFNEIKASENPSYFTGGQIGKFGYANSNNFVYELGSKVGIESQVIGFNLPSKKFAPGQYGGYSNTTALQSIQQQIYDLQSQISALFQQIFQ